MASGWAGSASGVAVGGDRPEDVSDRRGRWIPAPTGPPPPLIARAAVLAAFVALLVHTIAYASFYQDPITWVLLAAAASLAGGASTAFAPYRAVADKQRTRH